MTPAAERRADAGSGRGDTTARRGGAAAVPATHTAFGLALAIDPRIELPGLAPIPARTRPAAAPTLTKPALSAPAQPPAGWGPAEPPTRVLLDPEELHRRWAAHTAEPVRTREVRWEEQLVRTVDFAEPAGYLLFNRDHGRVLIAPDGRALWCEPDPHNPQWTAIVAAQALPLAATLRGLEVVHAAGVVLDGRALLIAGAAGAGKSSLAAALLRAGGRLLSDDAVALALDGEGTPIAHAGSLALQLRAPEHERLCAGERAALGRPAGVVEGKRRYVSDGAAAAPLGALLLLERSAAQPAVERLEAVSPFELLASTFNLSVRTPARLRRQLDVVGAIAARGCVYRLRVQPGVDATQLAARVLELA
ncbi:MAG TPA: hypothetical protein VNV37_10340 [Solirubrobacteraceae bacterium]|jgi:hypothetical protein|nr:hypothetical protein [Solirubrobacteraceae bacterium]